MFRTAIATLVLAVALSQIPVPPAGLPQGCPTGFFWDPVALRCQPIPQQTPGQTPAPVSPTPQIALPGVPSLPFFGSGAFDSSRRGRFNDLPPLPYLAQDCKLNFYWSGLRCIPYSEPDKCVRGWTFNFNTYTCTPGPYATYIVCVGDRYFNGVLCVDRPRRGAPVCVPGWVWNEIGDRCFKLPPGPEACQAGQVFNGLTCAALTTPIPNDFCKNGWTWYAVKSICTPPSTANRVCVGGYFNGYNCVPYSFPNRCVQLWVWDPETFTCRAPAGHNQCPDRYYWNGEACLPVSLPNECITNWEWDINTRTCKDNSRVICISGYFNGRTCIPFSNPGQCEYGWNWVYATYTCYKDINIRCERGEYYNGEECLRSRGGRGRCVSGWTWDDERNTCIRERAVDRSICPTRFNWDGTKCVTDTTCAAGYTTQDGWCAQTTGNCPKGQYWSQADRNCLLITTASCPTDYYFDGRVCAQIISGSLIQQCTSNQFRWAFATSTCVPVGSGSGSSSGSGSGSGTPTPECRNGRVWNGSECIACRWPNYWNGVYCNGIQPPLCALGTWNGRICA